MKILISGSSGLIGSALTLFLRERGHEILQLMRRPCPSNVEAIYWNPDQQQIDREKIEGMDAVIHLAGENLAAKRWDETQKQKISSSRVQGTQFLCANLKVLKKPPKLLISASAVGYYGKTSSLACSEDAPKGSGFLSDVCAQWEAAAEEAKIAGMRTVLTRFGIVLSTQGGALAKMLLPFKMGLGGKLGSGDQWMSWATLDDVLHALLFILEKPALEGPVNVVSPQSVTNRQFTKILGKVLHRPTFLSVPSFVIKLLVGKEMAEEVFLSSVDAVPKKLTEAGFTFRDRNLEDALKNLLRQAS